MSFESAGRCWFNRLLFTFTGTSTDLELSVEGTKLLRTHS
jgi:hypothetical protein